MSRLLRAVTIFGAALVFCALIHGCQSEGRDSIISAVGSYGDIAVVLSDPELDSHLVRFREVLNPQEIFVIRQEDTYRFHDFTADNWRNGRNYRNLLFVCRWGGGGGVESAVKKMLSDKTLDRLTSGRGGVVTVRDPFFRNQLAIVAVARNPNDLVRTLNSHADALRDTLSRDINRRIMADNRRQGLLPGVAESAWRRFGFSLELPDEFKENQTRPGGYPGVEWIRTDGTMRGVTVSWEAVDAPTMTLDDHDTLAMIRSRMGEAMHDEGMIESDSFVWTEELVNGCPVVKLAGNWQSRRVEVGGPFWCYFLADEAGRRIYCVDLLVYAPNKEKMDYFRRLRASLETFSLAEPTP